MLSLIRLYGASDVKIVYPLSIHSNAISGVWFFIIPVDCSKTPLCMLGTVTPSVLFKLAITWSSLTWNVDALLRISNWQMNNGSFWSFNCFSSRRIRFSLYHAYFYVIVYWHQHQIRDLVCNTNYLLIGMPCLCYLNFYIDIQTISWIPRIATKTKRHIDIFRFFWSP